MLKKEESPLISYLFVTQNRKEELKEAIDSVLAQNYEPKEVIVVDNNSSDGTQKLFRNNFESEKVKYIKLGENRGVCGGRNVAIEAAEGRILITMDDDAIISPENATERIVNRFTGDDDLGILAFKVLNYYTGELQESAFPTRDEGRSPEQEFNVATFIGVGHAVLDEVYQDVGLYGDYFPYGHEELDLAFRVLDMNFDIVYFPEVIIKHKVKPRSDRLSGRWDIVLENRIKVAIRNLPWKYVLSTTLAWSLKTLIDLKGDVRPVLKAFSKLFSKRSKLLKERKKIGEDTIKRISKLKGPLYY